MAFQVITLIHKLKQLTHFWQVHQGLLTPSAVLKRSTTMIRTQNDMKPHWTKTQSTHLKIWEDLLSLKEELLAALELLQPSKMEKKTLYLKQPQPSTTIELKQFSVLKPLANKSPNNCFPKFISVDLYSNYSKESSQKSKAKSALAWNRICRDSYSTNSKTLSN